MGQRFWELSTADELRLVSAILAARFPETYQRLSEALESADPFEVVYAGNPGEYDDVVREVIVLLAPVDGDLGSLDRRAIERLVREGLSRCFGEEADEARFQHAVDLLAESPAP
jgi:hypothetical protein